MRSMQRLLLGQPDEFEVRPAFRPRSSSSPPIGLRVSKLLGYSVLQPPGLAVSKLVGYSVLQPPGLAVAKLLGYVVLQTYVAPVSVPISAPRQRHGLVDDSEYSSLVLARRRRTSPVVSNIGGVDSTLHMFVIY